MMEYWGSGSPRHPLFHNSTNRVFRVFHAGREQGYEVESIWQIPKNAIYNFFMDSGFTLAAALAFYAILSVAPLLVLLITVFGLVGESTQQQIIQQTEKLIGPQASQGVELIVRSARTQRVAATASATIGLVVLLFSATSVFGQLQYSLNTVFNVRWKRGILTGGSTNGSCRF